MAITKCLYLNASNSGGTKKSIHLKNSLDYILDEHKTSKHNFEDKHLGELTKYIKQNHKVAHNETHYISSVNCTVTNAYEEMQKTKEHFGKTEGRVAYHYIIAFKPNEIESDTAWKITEEFVKQFLNNEYECVYALHTDKAHIHSHIVFNSVNYKTGKKFRSPYKDWEKRIQPLVDKLCIENGVAPLEYHIDEYINDEGKKVVSYEYSKNFNFTERIKIDIDESIAQSDTFEEFCEYLKKEKNYQIKFGKYMALKLPDMDRYRRLKETTVGTDYTFEMINERIAFKNGEYALPKRFSIPIVFKTYIKKSKQKYKKYKDMNFIEKASIRRMLRMKKLKEKIGYQNSYLQEQQIKKLNQAIKNYYFIRENHISSDKDVKDILSKNQKTKSMLFSEYRKNNSRIKYSTEIMDIYGKLNDLQIYYDLYTKYSDKDFVNEYNKYITLEKKLNERGITLNEIDDYTKRINENNIVIKKQLQTINNDINICKRLLNNSTTKKKNKNNSSLKEKNIYDISNSIDKNIKNITINTSLIINDDDNYTYTRVPSTFGENLMILRINKKDLEMIDDNKTIVTQIDLSKSIVVLDKDYKEININGSTLYKYYDIVDRKIKSEKNKVNKR